MEDRLCWKQTFSSGSGRPRSNVTSDSAPQVLRNAITVGKSICCNMLRRGRLGRARGPGCGLWRRRYGPWRLGRPAALPHLHEAHDSLIITAALQETSCLPATGLVLAKQFLLPQRTGNRMAHCSSRVRQNGPRGQTTLSRISCSAVWHLWQGWGRWQVQAEVQEWVKGRRCVAARSAGDIGAQQPAKHALYNTVALAICRRETTLIFTEAQAAQRIEAFLTQDDSPCASEV